MMLDVCQGGHIGAGSPDMAAHVGPAGWARLAPAIRWRFGDAQAHRPRTYRGAMDLWRSPAGLVFALLGRAFGRPLPCCAGRGVPAVVQVRPDGGGIRWDRLLHTGARPERVSSIKEDGPNGLQERTSAGLIMELDIFERGEPWSSAAGATWCRPAAGASRSPRS